MNDPVYPRYKSTSTLCRELEVSPVTIWRWVKCGKLPAPRKINGKNRWSADVEPLFDDEIEGRDF
tara:strand:- start:267 stop:461 length:195 start_codon:yes stop_codon:yes gene_type:complete